MMLGDWLTAWPADNRANHQQLLSVVGWSGSMMTGKSVLSQTARRVAADQTEYHQP